jgi:hypothetical protein
MWKRIETTIEEVRERRYLLMTYILRRRFCAGTVRMVCFCQLGDLPDTVRGARLRPHRHPSKTYRAASGYQYLAYWSISIMEGTTLAAARYVLV